MEDNKDKLEKFVNASREEFDQKFSEKDMWSKIAPQIPVKKKTKMVPLYQAISIAATVLLVCGISIFLITKNWNTKQAVVVPTTAEIPQKELELSDFTPELAEAEQYYTKEVELKLNEVKKLNMDEDVLQEIKFLDEEFNTLKKELGETNNEKVIEAMIENYQLKLEILQEILDQTKEQNNEKDNIHI